MKIEWVEEKFPDLSGQNGAFNKAANDGKQSTFMPKKVPMIRTCHNDLVPASGAVMNKMAG